MSAATSLTYILGQVRLQAVKGHPQLSVIRLRATAGRRTARSGRKVRADEMTEQDWDKFEKDIDDAFEQVP